MRLWLNVTCPQPPYHDHWYGGWGQVTIEKEGRHPLANIRQLIAGAQPGEKDDRMDIAFRLHDLKEGVSGGYDVITASELRKLGKTAARELNFVCAQAGCHIKMLPVFPEAVGKDGKVLECHFRAHPGTYHKGHGIHQKPIDGTASSVETSSLIGNKPSGWRDPTPPRLQVASEPKADIAPPRRMKERWPDFREQDRGLPLLE